MGFPKTYICPALGLMAIVAALAWSCGRCSAAVADVQVPAVDNALQDQALQDTPKPKPIDPPSAEEIENSIRRGVDFLLQRQLKSGAWGSARQTKGFNVYVPVPGAHQAFRAAVTSLCISALIESGDRRAEVVQSIDAAQQWLLAHLKSVRRATPDALYNNWAHAYSIQALVDLYRYREAGGESAGESISESDGRSDDASVSRPDSKSNADKRALLEEIKQHIAWQVDMLARYECVDGGWAYYDDKVGTQKPGDSTISFVSATVLIALKEARELGVEVPQRIVDRAMVSIVRQRLPGFAYCYGEYTKYWVMCYIHRPGGSLGRSQVCNLAMHLWGDKKTTLAVMRVWLDRLFARNMWLDIARKRPLPHESWMQVAGYFYYYGHFYAACSIEQFPSEEQPYFQGHLAHILIPLQEKDGSWWDYPLYDYHQQYGTALAVMSLVRCREGR